MSSRERDREKYSESPQNNDHIVGKAYNYDFYNRSSIKVIICLRRRSLVGARVCSQSEELESVAGPPSCGSGSTFQGGFKVRIVLEP